MILRTFKSAQPAPLFLIPVFCLIAVIAAYLKNTAFLVYDLQHGFLYALLLKLPLLQQRWICEVFSFLMLSFQALYFNYIINKQEVLYKQSNLPAALYVLIFSTIPDFLVFNPFLLINCLLPVIIYKTFLLYKSEQTLSVAFDSCFLIAIATMIYFPAVLLLIFYLVSLSILRPFSWREWVTSFLGFMLPWFLVWTVLFLMNQSDLLLPPEPVRAWKPVLLLSTITKQHFITGIFYIGVLLLALGKLRTNFYKNVIKMRKFQLCFLVLFLLMLIIVLVPLQHSVSRFNLIVLPLTLFLSYYFVSIKKSWWFELLFLFMLALILFNYV
jgi:hypothetical protein